MRARNFWAVVLLGFLAASCRQDPIFFIISTETAPRKPRIEGAPTNMVVFEREYPDREEPVPIMYVASGRLHWYTKTSNNISEWDSDEYPIPQPEGKIISLAVGKGANGEGAKRLYALCRDGSGVNAKLRYIESRYTPGEDWKTIDTNEYPVIQSIYAVPETGRLFAGTGRNTYAILYLDTGTDTFKLLKDNTSIFSGVVCRKEGDEFFYYLSTRGDGLRWVSETALRENITINWNDTEEDKTLLMNIIKLEDDTIIAVERDGGALYEVQRDHYYKMEYTIENNNDPIATGRYATGALALWEDPERSIKALVAGIQGTLYNTTTSSYTHGYVEFELNSDGSFNTGVTRKSAGSLQSVDDQDRYTASIGKYPVNHLFQAPKEVDENMTFFASTQTAGLWSYRDRPDNGGWQWNAEE